jgi:hypothetical protein
VSQRPLGLMQYNRTGETNCIVLGTAGGWFRWDAGTTAWVSITGTALTGASTNFVNFRVMNVGGTNYLIGVNGKDAPQKWDGTSGTYAAVGGSPPTTAKSIAVCSNRCVMLDGNTLYHSDYNAFETGWPTVLVKALIDTPGDGVGLLEMGNTQYVAYKKDAIYVASAPGPGVYPFSFSLKATGI